jgi:hypothetical protein
MPPRGLADSPVTVPEIEPPPAADAEAAKVKKSETANSAVKRARPELI